MGPTSSTLMSIISLSDLWPPSLRFDQCSRLRATRVAGTSSPESSGK